MKNIDDDENDLASDDLQTDNHVPSVNYQDLLLKDNLHTKLQCAVML